MSDQPVVSVERRNEAVVLHVQVGRLDHALTGKMKQEVAAAAAANPRLPVLLELSKLEFVPSVGLGALVELNKVLRQGGQRLLLAGANRQIRSTLAVSRLDKLLSVHTDVDAALASMRPPA